MSEYRISHRYARALVDSVQTDKELGKISVELAGVRALILSSADLRRFLANPMIKPLKKREVFTEVFKRTTSKRTIDFLLFVFDKRREMFLADIIEQFFVIKDEREGIRPVHVLVPKPLSKAEEKSMNAAIERWTGGAIRMTVDLDPSLIGGFTARVGDMVLDSSVKQQLHLLREKLRTGISKKFQDGNGTTIP